MNSKVQARKVMSFFRNVSKATIFLFLGLRISWPEKRVGRSEKKKKKKIIIINRPYYVKV